MHPGVDPDHVASIFFGIISRRALVEATKQAKELEKLKAIVTSSPQWVDDSRICAICHMPLDGVDDMARYCYSCNKPLPCATWIKERHMDDAMPKQCNNCDNYVCTDCFHDEWEQCDPCFKTTS